MIMTNSLDQPLRMSDVLFLADPIIDEGVAPKKSDEDKKHSRWATDAESNMFWGTGNTVDTMPPGMYKCGYQDNIGPCLSKVIIETDDLISMPDMMCQEAINQITTFWSEEVRKKMETRGFLHKRGILMYGEPGSGKTCTIQMLVSMLIKDGGIAIHAEDPHVLASCLQLVRRIEPDRPMIVILEDFDTLTDRDRRENTWLAVLDGEAQVSNVVFLATTNYIENLDKRIVDRPSRFDMILPVPMPSAKARMAYIKYKEPEISNEELYKWVQASSGYSIAHLKEMILSIVCYGKTLEETCERLDASRKRNFSNADLEFEAKGSGGMGFVKTESDSKFSSIEEFEKFAQELEGWDYNV